MKTKNIATLLTTVFTMVFAVSAAAAPPGKGLRTGTLSKKSDSPKAECRIGEEPEQRLLKRTGPPGKGMILQRASNR